MEVEIVNRSPKPPPEKEGVEDLGEGVVQGGQEHGPSASCQRKRPAFEKLPRRWVAERTFSWLSHNRTMSKEYERLCSTGEAFIHLAMARLMARRRLDRA